MTVAWASLHLARSGATPRSNSCAVDVEGPYTWCGVKVRTAIPPVASLPSPRFSESACILEAPSSATIAS